jgi:ankyrin repeat protein
MTPLHHAAVEGSPEIIKILIKSGADANTADSSKRLPLHWACANGFLEAAR